jgi:hypothetical protein
MPSPVERPRTRVLIAGACALLICFAPARAQEPHGLGWQSEPAMEFGGRSLATIQELSSSFFGRTSAAARQPALAASWEFPTALILFLAQHEVMGHGGRAREFDLGPSYGVGFDFSAYTEIDETPETNEQNILLGAAGSEASTVLSRRLLLDLHQPGGGEGSGVPLLMLSKIDLTLYVMGTLPPGDDEGDFEDQYEEGNDVAYYLVSRQALRAGADPAQVWDGDYPIDFDDRLLDENWDEVRLTALWNLLDPAFVMSIVGYFQQHLGEGERHVTPLVWKVSPGLGLTLGTRGALGVGEVSRFMDLYMITKRGIGSLYVRDLDSSTDRTYGFGAGFHRAPLGSHLRLSVQGDWWDEPAAAERSEPISGWNATLEIDWAIRGGWGVSAMVGKKSGGFYPGLPADRGAYTGFGILASF